MQRITCGCCDLAAITLPDNFPTTTHPYGWSCLPEYGWTCWSCKTALNPPKPPIVRHYVPIRKEIWQNQMYWSRPRRVLHYFCRKDAP